MLQALNTGHDGSLCTIHANGTRDALRRLETLALFGGATLPLGAVRDQIVSCIDAVVFVARRRGRRVVTEVAEVVDARAAGPSAEAAPATRPLAQLDGSSLVVVGEPSRVSRRAGVGPV